MKYSEHNMLYFILFFSMLVISCKKNIKTFSDDKNTQFTLIPSSHSNINFNNTIEETQAFNFLTYPYIYNGGGVSIGDINNDGFEDIFFSSNQGNNSLYLNKGNFNFEDISKKSGIQDSVGWTTGISMIDINNDGWLDIYVCKSGETNNPKLRENKLYINNKNNTFSNEAEKYNLNDPSFTSQAYFFDFDNDTDLDVYLVNHRIDFTNNTKISSEIQNNLSPFSSDKLLLNNNSKFTNIFKNGINKTWGLSASITDINNDGWLDIYVCNDFLEPDQLFLNTPEGGFENKINSVMDHISFYSMGSDVADINNDSKIDLIVLDMSPNDHKRAKKNMASMNVEQFNSMVDFGYNHQYMTNVLQLNRGNSIFSDIAQFAGISKTDWSWAPLIADFNNDGLKDVFITNGIRRDMTENDLRTRIKSQYEKSGALSITDALNLAISERLQNPLFMNKGNATFEEKTSEWGMNKKSFSNGSAYGDLDNDGDLDLVVNNIDDEAFIYKNNSSNNYISVKLLGNSKNVTGISSIVEVFTKDKVQTNQLFLNRGFQSSMSPVINFGLGSFSTIDSLRVKWPNGNHEVLYNIDVNQLITLDIKNSKKESGEEELTRKILSKHSTNLISNYTHKENKFDDFKEEILLPQKQSTYGPKSCVGDVNNDGLDDYFITGSKGFSASLFIQDLNHNLIESNVDVFSSDKEYEDTGCSFLDIDNDNDLDLYVISGGNEFEKGSKMLQDRIYINDGKGNFRKDINRLPIMNTSGYAIAEGDFDQDGDIDLFVGGRIIPGQYPVAPRSYLLENNNGYFKDISQSKSPELQNIGLITDAIFSDYDNDKDLDLIIVGEWMVPTVFVNKGDIFNPKPLTDQVSEGWWYTITADDFNNDGLDDYFLGNLGENNKFKVDKDKSLHLYASDFDNSGNIDIVLANESKTKLLPVRGKQCSSEQMPFIGDKFKDFASFAEADLNDIYTQEKLEQALHLVSSDFKSAVLINDGEGLFSKPELPKIVQYGPTLSTLAIDLNNDGYKDIIGAGSIFETEPETVKYDASKGFVLLNDGKENFNESGNHDFLLRGNIKDIQTLKIGKDKIIISLQNNGPIQSFKIEN